VLPAVFPQQMSHSPFHDQRQRVCVYVCVCCLHVAELLAYEEDEEGELEDSPRKASDRSKQQGGAAAVSAALAKVYIYIWVYVTCISSVQIAFCTISGSTILAATLQYVLPGGKKMEGVFAVLAEV